jgi:hypothetical protein
MWDSSSNTALLRITFLPKMTFVIETGRPNAAPDTSITPSTLELLNVNAEGEFVRVKVSVDSKIVLSIIIPPERVEPEKLTVSRKTV